MKKSLFYLAATLLIATTSCSEDNNDNAPKGQESNITLYAPDDLEEFDLLYENPTRKLKFEWESDKEGATYALIFSLDEEMNNIERIDIGTEMYTSLTHQDLDDLLGKLGVGEYKRGELYWAVESENEGILSRSEIRSMKLFRFYKPFIDPRDNEEYRVCRVFDPISEDYAVWLADNLRATTYSDGTPLGENDVKFYTPQEGEDESWTKVFGGYYTWTATMRGTRGAEEGEKIQGIAPEGWHIPTKTEWDFLINACGDPTMPATILKEKSYWDPNAGDVGMNSIGFNMAGTGYIWSIPENDVIEAFANTYFWTSTAPKDGDVYPWNPDPVNFPNQGVTYGFTLNDSGAALYPYDRNRGYSVRCVLD